MFQIGDLVLWGGLICKVTEIRNDLIYKIRNNGYGSMIVSKASLIKNQVPWFKPNGNGSKWRKL